MENTKTYKRVNKLHNILKSEISNEEKLKEIYLLMDDMRAFGTQRNSTLFINCINLLILNNKENDK